MSIHKNSQITSNIYSKEFYEAEIKIIYRNLSSKIGILLLALLGMYLYYGLSVHAYWARNLKEWCTETVTG